MNRRIPALLLTLSLSLSSFAQILPSANPAVDSLAFAKVRARMDSIRKYRPTVGLVLAGGGARGLAHLGVIKYMEELGIPVDIVTGTSMGGLVGGLYALGYKHDQLDSLVRSIDWPVMMSDNIPDDYVSYRIRKYRERFVLRIPFHYDNEDLKARLERERVLDKMVAESGGKTSDVMNESLTRAGLGMPDGFLYGLNVRNTLSSVSVGYQDSLSFADLPIPFACVATDMYSLKPKYWTSGSITDALRSTMAIPFYFRAVRKDGEVLLDGGMRNNFPTDLAREMGADIIIGSDMAVHRGVDELNSPVDFLFQTISLLSSSTADPTMELTDIDVHHELKGYTMLSFDDKSVNDIINQGYQNALSHKELFASIAALVAGKPVPEGLPHPAPAVNLAQQKVPVSSVRFTGIGWDDRKNVLDFSKFPRDGMYNRATVERLLNDIYGTNAFESVTYHLEGKEAPYTLVLDCQKGQVNDFAVGIRADTDESVAAALHLGLGTRRLSGPRLTTDIKLGTNPALSVDGAYKFRSSLPTVGMTLRSRLMTTTLGYMDDTNEKLLTAATDLYLEDSRLRFGSMRLGLTAEMAPFERYLDTTDYRFGWDWRSYWLSTFLNLKHDTFDDGYFPTRGVRLCLDGRYVFKGYSIDKDSDFDPSTLFPEDLDGEDGDVPDPVSGATDDIGESEGPGPEFPKDWIMHKGSPVEPYVSVLAGIEAAISPWENFTILPSVHFGWHSAEHWYMNPLHSVVVGGFLPNRYVERQIPFFGFPNGFKYSCMVNFVTQLDLRYRFARKNFVTARGGLFWRDDLIKEFLTVSPVYAFGVEYARQTAVGPFRLAVQWCDITGVTAYASIGFDF